MKIARAFGTFFLLASFVFVTPVFAGGTMFGAYADSDGWISDAGFGRIIRVYINPTYPCKGTEVTFSFNKPENGDIITTGSNGQTYTFTEDRQTYYKDGITAKTCSTYAKFTSKNSETRMVEVDVKNSSAINTPGFAFNVDFDGKHHDNVNNGYTYRSSIDDPYFSFYGPNGIYKATSTPVSSTSQTPVTISNTINTWVLNQKLDNNNRQVTVKWGAFDGNPGMFSVMVKPTNNKTDWDKIAWEQRGPSATITIPNEDYYLKLYGCADKYGYCTDSNILWLPKITIENGKVVVPSVVPVTSNAKIDELNKKVNDLQNQLDQSKKTQSSLEQRINDLVNFIKKLFPFFK